MSICSLSSEGPWPQTTQCLATGPPEPRSRFILTEQSWGRAQAAFAVGQGLSKRALLLFLFQMRIARVRATLTTGSKVRAWLPTSMEPLPSPGCRE